MIIKEYGKIVKWFAGRQFPLDGYFFTVVSTVVGQVVTVHLSAPSGILVTIRWGDGSLDFVTGTGSSTNYTHTYTYTGTYGIYLNAKQIEDIDISGSATYGCVHGPSMTITNVEFPTTVTSLNTDVCRRFAITSVTIPDSVTSIGMRAFHTCNSLTSVTIPSNVTSIGDGAFYDNTSLSSITFLPTRVPTFGSNVFSGLPSTGIAYVPQVVLSEYTTALRNADLPSGWTIS